MSWDLLELRKIALEIEPLISSRKRIPNQRTLDILQVIKDKPGCSHTSLAKHFSCSTNGLFEHLKFLVETEKIIVSKMPIQGGFSWSIFPFVSGVRRTSIDYIRPVKQPVRLAPKPSNKAPKQSRIFEVENTDVQFERIENLGSALSNEDFSPFALSNKKGGDTNEDLYINSNDRKSR